MSEGHVHLHKTGHSWVDLSVALCAIVLSVASLAVAIHHGHAMEKLVIANSLPYVQLESSNSDEQGNPTVIRLQAVNAGTGPARIAKVLVTYDGKPVTSARELLAACCALDGATPARLVVSTLAGKLVIARGEVDYVALRKGSNDPRVYERFDAERSKVRTRVCYCSVFDECWVTDQDAAEPKRVADCSALHGEPYLD